MICEVHGSWLAAPWFGLARRCRRFEDQVMRSFLSILIMACGLGVAGNTARGATAAAQRPNPDYRPDAGTGKKVP